MKSSKNIKFFGLTIAFFNTRGTAKTLKLPNKLELPKSTPGNFLVCPLSIEVLLALTLTGAKGRTSTEIANGLLLPRNPDRIQQAFQELSHYFKENENYNLSSTNRIYVQDGTKINDQFKQVAITSFHADMQSINFHNKDQVMLEINKWVSEKTSAKVTGVGNKDILEDNIQMALINTVYFKGRTVKEFSRATTGKRQFFINKSDYVDTTMLESIGYFNLSENSKLKAKMLELPYEGDDITATLVLPDDRTGLAGLETHIAEFFILPQYKKEPVHVLLPKCKISSAIHFTDILQGLGIRDAFKDSADFSGILKSAGPLKISTVLHKTFIDGEELKKSSLIGTRLLETIITPSSFHQPQQFYADHPFVFYLKHRITGVFFIGRLYRIDGAIQSIPIDPSSNKNKLK